MSNIISRVKSLGSLNVNKFNTLNTAIAGIDKDAFESSKSKFNKQLDQAKIMKSAKEWIKGEEGKKKLGEIGYAEMNIKLLMTEVYGYESPKFPNRMIQVYTAIAKDAELKKDYIQTCKDESLQTSIQGFLKWNKKVTDNGGDTEGIKAKDGREKSLTTFASEGISARIDSQNNFKTSCDIDEVLKAIDEFRAKIVESQQAARLQAGINLTTADLS